MNRVLADCDPVVVVELLLLDRLSIDKRAVRAPEVDDEELIPATLDARVVSAGRRVAKDEIVVGRTPQTESAFAGAIGVARVRT
jgi:hypothetical protein